MSVVILVNALADGRQFKAQMWLESYDVDAVPPPDRRSYFTDDGVAVVHGSFGGMITLTPRLADARRFATASDAMLAWNTVSDRRPLRPDGRPNKPLTALTVTIEPVGL
jgi:hypothetical protein